MTAKLRLARYLGPLSPVFGFFLVSLVFLSLTRLGFVVWKWDRVAAVQGLWKVLGAGVRMDVMLLSIALALPTLISLLLPPNDKIRRIWHPIQSMWLTAYAALIVFMELATPSFVDQFGVRPNRLFFEYLNHPQEVFSTLWASYKIALILATTLMALTIWAVWNMSGRLGRASQPWTARRTFFAGPLILIILFLGARSSFDHRPANMSTVAFCGDPLVNTLSVSSTYSLGYAVYGLHGESDLDEYGKMANDEVIRRVRKGMGLPESAFTNPNIPTLHRQVPKHKRERPLNLVIILGESLGAEYVQSLGGLPLTPELEKLSRKGLWFSRLYATGDRSIRGVEAVVTGFPPTPARSIFKLHLSQHGFFSLASLLKREGYATQFIYGGDSEFDNMKGFCLGNGFDRMIDEKDFGEHVFRGTWGFSDEDIFNRTHQELLAHGDKPFFTMVFTISNHPPFEFPDGRIDLHGKPKNTLHNAVRYADHALGKFFEQARKAPYWDRTVFLVVADHEDRVPGDELVPVKYFHIPALIIGPDIEPGLYDKVASQIDLPPTLLSIMGIKSNHPMQGQDLLQTPENYPGRAIMQFNNSQAYMVGDQVVIHTPNRPAIQYVFRNDKLEPTQEQPELIRDALAQALWPIIAYREKQYRLDEGRSTSKQTEGAFQN
ncbi:MAG: Lipoteichoic acid synthase 2 [Syntrophorhabdus sp. PtaU1.Bin002]|nr:MAG: Lipoteichoic acid synthase 2 [Syntrophorhabdus sp. PtaU1.Bin002]